MQCRIVQPFIFNQQIIQIKGPLSSIENQIFVILWRSSRCLNLSPVQVHRLFIFLQFCLLVFLSWAYLRHILGISWAYLGYILGLSLALTQRIQSVNFWHFYCLFVFFFCLCFCLSVTVYFCLSSSQFIFNSSKFIGIHLEAFSVRFIVFSYFCLLIFMSFSLSPSLCISVLVCLVHLKFVVSVHIRSCPYIRNVG